MSARIIYIKTSRRDVYGNTYSVMECHNRRGEVLTVGVYSDSNARFILRQAYGLKKDIPFPVVEQDGLRQRDILKALNSADLQEVSGQDAVAKKLKAFMNRRQVKPSAGL
jgi:hypothetical protein